MGERRGRTNQERIAVFVERLELLPVTVDDRGAGVVFDAILPLAREHRLTVYDAMYLELAKRRGLPLASFDADLNAAAGKAGVALLGVA